MTKFNCLICTPCHLWCSVCTQCSCNCTAVAQDMTYCWYINNTVKKILISSWGLQVHWLTLQRLYVLLWLWFPSLGKNADLVKKTSMLQNLRRSSDIFHHKRCNVHMCIAYCEYYKELSSKYKMPHILYNFCCKPARDYKQHAWKMVCPILSTDGNTGSIR